MAIPWLVALRAIPWGTILANAPSILRSANALRSKSQTRPDTAVGTNDVQALSDRVAALEHRDRESVEVIAQLTAQVDALTTASEVLEARARWLFVIAVVSLAISILGAGAALFMR